MIARAIRRIGPLFLGILLLAGNPQPLIPQGVGSAGPQMKGVEGDPLRDPREAHLRNIRQLTTGGTNAEAYFSYDGKHLIFQATRDGFTCDQIFVMDLEGSIPKLVSTGKGRTTCGYFLPGDRQVVYASTHLAETTARRVPTTRVATSGPSIPATRFSAPRSTGPSQNS